MPPRHACDVCFKRKIQCCISNAGPPCDWCSHQGIACTFTRAPLQKKQRRITQETVSELFRRIEELESGLPRKGSSAAISNESSPTASSTVHPPDGSSLSENSPSVVANLPAGFWSASPPGLLRPSSLNSSDESSGLIPRQRHRGLNWYYKGMRVLSERGLAWMSSRTGQDIVLDTFLPLNIGVDQFSHSACPSTVYVPQQHLGELPEERTTHEATVICHHLRSRFSLPVFDQLMLTTTVKKAYQVPLHANSSRFQIPARACVWAIHAIASWLQPGWNQTIPASDICASRARTLLGLVAEESTLEGLQAVLLLQAYNSFTGQWRSSSFLHPLSCRMVCDLGGHFLQSDRLPTPEASFTAHRTYYIRELFWLCYILDKNSALRSGLPPVLTEEYCDLTWPPQSAVTSHSDVDERTRRLRNEANLSVIKEKTCKLLYSPEASRVTDTQLLLNVRQLDDELEQWRLAIPPIMRPRLTAPLEQPFLTPGADLAQRVEYINLQLDYHYTLTAFHTTVGRCGTANENESLPEDLHCVMHSSIDISLEAGRSTLLFLKASVGTLGEGAFQHIYLYAPNAAMTLFVNILIHPLYERALSDLDLLAATFQFLQNTPFPTLSTHETQLLEKLNNFLMQLVRLGKCAVWKAKEGED